MQARIQKLLADLGNVFWLLPSILVCGGILAAIVLVHIDRSGIVPKWLLEGWLYNGGGTGARTLLGAVASSTIGVAGTVFSITIAALSLAAGQMGPRLLRNFTRDRGNQITLGIFLGTFAYALMVLRSVRTHSEGEFVPQLSLSFAIFFALICVGTLVYFVHHMSRRINVDTVINLVSQDVRSAIDGLEKYGMPSHRTPSAVSWQDGAVVTDDRQGYLQHVDCEGLARWAADKSTSVRLLLRPGEYLFPGAPIAVIKPPVIDAEEAIVNATVFGSEQFTSGELEFAVRQLVEVAVRALSSGINDPLTAISVLEQLGGALCGVVGRDLGGRVHTCDGRAVLVVPSLDYANLIDVAFHLIRQNGMRQPALLIRILEVLAAVATCERNAHRVREIRRHARLVLDDAERSIENASDLADVRDRYAKFEAAAGGSRVSLVGVGEIS